ncbi:hypothetical protein B0H13DRAFT_2511867 [Mycena leptocephala]|nr:hypothetical protein B0H13DRAFT_2511867 [Mycena leptocephala]
MKFWTLSAYRKKRNKILTGSLRLVKAIVEPFRSLRTRAVCSTPGVDRALLVDIEAQILHLERSLCVSEDLRHLKRSLATLRAEKILLQRRLASYRYPVLTLPNEIVSHIFIHFLQLLPQFPPLAGQFSPTLLTLICRQWQEIALDMPELWRAIHLPGYDNDGTRTFERKRHIADTWLNRSRSYPLYIHINLNQHSPRARRGTYDFISALVPHSARWEHLELWLQGPMLAGPMPLLPMIAGPMPLLRHLNLALSGSSPTVFELEAPLLRTVIINGPAARSVTLPWVQLTSLTLRDLLTYDSSNLFTPASVWPILRQTSNLLHCELHLSFYHDQPTPDITLSRLETLILDSYMLRATGFLHTLVVPALRTLHVAEDMLGRARLRRWHRL